MQIHPDSAALEGDAFGLEADALLGSGFGGEQNFSRGSENPVPRQPSFRFRQGPGNAPRIPWKSRGLGDGPVRRDFPPRYLRDHFTHLFQHPEPASIRYPCRLSRLWA